MSPPRTPVPAKALPELKAFALRFAKKLEQLTNQRLRGRKLYDCLAKSLQWNSFYELVNRSKRTNGDFPWTKYQAQFARLVYSHLPFSVDSDDVFEAANHARAPGIITITVDARCADWRHIQSLAQQVAFSAFEKETFHGSSRIPIIFEKRMRPVLGLMDDPQPIYVCFDFSKYRADDNPVTLLNTYEPFIQMVYHLANLDNKVSVLITKIKPDKSKEYLKTLNPNGKEHWVTDNTIRTHPLLNSANIQDEILQSKRSRSPSTKSVSISNLLADRSWAADSAMHHEKNFPELDAQNELALAGSHPRNTPLQGQPVFGSIQGELQSPPRGEVNNTLTRSYQGNVKVTFVFSNRQQDIEVFPNLKEAQQAAEYGVNGRCDYWSATLSETQDPVTSDSFLDWI